MIRPVAKLWVVAIATLVTFSAGLTRVFATAPALATPPNLSFAEIQITGNGQEFVLIQNNSASNISDLSVYWLYQHNKSNPLAAGATTSTQQLPATGLDSGKFLLLSSAAQNTCGAQVAGRLGVSLPDAEGSLELLSSTGGTIASSDTDFVSWNGASPAITDAVASSNPQPVFYRYQSGSSYPWEKAYFDSATSCQLDVYAGGNQVSAANLIQSTDSPTAVVVAASAVAGVPPGDDGLIAPQITELLPNPTGTGNDKTDEFVELYNPNNTAFDLSGFTIESGLSAKYDYTFDNGSSLPAKSYVAFYSADTGLTLSNTGGQAWLLDPTGGIIAQTDAYGSAKDGQAWAWANKLWQWTAKPTPNAANIIILASSQTKSKTHTTPTLASAKTSSAGGGSSSSSSSFNQTNQAPTPLHPWTLAGVGSAALLYAGYEYRTDLANHFYRLRRHYETRRAAGK